ncbi:flavodoxin I [Evansella vedderi]|uniref:Flavodoxin I n=1 Tax=Evansella vedderi TaxID=38282 RepID=A0ABT9ZSA9_9BACI|nr:flavodoxin domain-containing protein [Evansella vedderi]MDQ0254118.1 flavodoxin I [Evansella vedderi]
MKIKVAIIYTSKTGNTKELAEMVYYKFLNFNVKVDIISIKNFDASILSKYDIVSIGTYTWGNGEIPKEMVRVYRSMECMSGKRIISGVFGTGDSFYEHFCGAVDKFRDMLYVRSTLAATLKVELSPQLQDVDRVDRFVKALINKYKTI